MKVMDNLPEAHVFAIKLFHFCSDKVTGTSEAKNSQVIKFTYFITKEEAIFEYYLQGQTSMNCFYHFDGNFSL